MDVQHGFGMDRIEEDEQPKSEVAVIFEKINSGLQAFDERKTELLALKAEGDALNITSVEDKEMIAKITETRKKIKQERVKIQNEGKALRDPLTKVNREISIKENELVAILAPTEKELEKKEGWVEEERERLKQEKVAKEKQRIQERIDRLSALGYTIELSFIEAISDDDFEKVVQNAQTEFDKEEARKKQAKEDQERENERIEEERRELEDLRKQRRVFRMGQLKELGFRGDPLDFMDGFGMTLSPRDIDTMLAYPVAEWERKLVEFQANIDQFKRGQLLAERSRERAAQLIWPDGVVPIAWVVYGTSHIGEKEIAELDEDEFRTIRDEHNNLVNQEIALRKQKKEEEERRQTKEQENRIRGNERASLLASYNFTHQWTSLALGQMMEEEWQVTLTKAKEHQSELDRQEKDRKMAEATDKEKYEAVITYLKAAAMPEMKSNTYKSKLRSIKEFIHALK